jgi:hypothetical protein
MQSTTFRWRRWLAVAAGLVAVYAALGFWLLPLLVKDQLPKLAQSQLSRQASVGGITFNPFTLRLGVTDLKLAETDGAPLFSVGRLDVQLLWRSIVRRAWSFADIRVTAPVAALVIAPDGRFNVAELLATLERDPPSASSDASLPRLVIERFALEQGRVEMHDHRAGYSNVFAPIAFTLANFSTLPDQSDAHSLTARSAGGGSVHWKGTASVNPIRGSGELTLDKVSLPQVSVYLKSYTSARVAAGQLSATLPYSFSYADGKFAASLAGAKLALADLALAREGATDSFAALTKLEVTGIDADLATRQATVAQVRAEGGKLAVRRDAKGDIDLADLMVATAGPAAAAPERAVAVNNWKLAVKQVLFDHVAIAAVDESVNPPLKLDVGQVRLQLQLAAEQAGPDLQVKLADAAFAAGDITLASGTQPPFKLAQLGFTDGTLDLGAHRAVVGRVYAQGGQLQVVRDRQGAITIPGLWPRAAASAPRAAPSVPATGTPWSVVAKSAELSRVSADVQDEASHVRVHVSDLAVKLADAGSDLKQPVKFDASLGLREGGQLSAQGSVVPGSGALQAQVRVRQLALAPLQPLLAQYVKLKIAGGSVSAQGRLTAGDGVGKGAKLRYVGALDVAALRLNEADGDVFAQWRNVGADTLTATFAPNGLDIPELRVVDADAKLGIENDRSFNAARLLVHPTADAAKPAAPTAAAAGPTTDPFPVRVHRLRVQNAKLDFTDLSLRPQFAAKVYELNGVVTGLSSNRAARAQIELDGRVDEFGSARVRGELNPFAPRNNTDVNVVFKNVDMVPTSPYAMKFAGYRIAEGKISLDLQYKIRNGQLAGTNQIVIDNLRLGDRVDSPDALKLPLDLAIAILKDSDGRIDLGLPVSGDMSDPQFSYGAVIWKAVGSLLTRIVTAPFRALGRLFGGGGSGEQLESVTFDAGSDKLAPPEREKLQHIAQVLAKRPQLKLSVPAQYSETADGAALRARAVRLEIERRAGVKLQPGESPGPPDLGSRKVRSAIRDLYAARFGDAALDQQKKAAESAAAAPAAAAGTAVAPAAAASAAAGRQEQASQQLPLWQRVGKMIEGEPQVADASAFYRSLLQQLDAKQPLPEGELARLGTQRADAVLAALKAAGVDSSRAAAAPAEKMESSAGKPVALKLGLAAK